MRLFRIAREKYIDDLSGQGAKLYGGRWNKKGTEMLYFSIQLSLCVLEVLVHFNSSLMPKDLWYLEIELEDDYISKMPSLKKISEHLRDNPPHYSTMEFGSQWIEKNKSCALLVPSAILPLEKNVIINPNHLDWTKHKVIKKGLLELDSRVIN